MLFHQNIPAKPLQPCLCCTHEHHLWKTPSRRLGGTDLDGALAMAVAGDGVNMPSRTSRLLLSRRLRDCLVGGKRSETRFGSSALKEGSEGLTGSWEWVVKDPDV